MLTRLYLALRRNPITSRAVRNVSLMVKRWVGCPDPYEDLARLIRHTRPAAILDIGSFIGGTIAHFLESNSVPIHGFEPAADTYQRLSERYRGHPLVQVHRLALCDKDGEVPFFRNQNPQTNSLLDNDSGNQSAFPAYTQHVEQVMVPTARLDTWAARHCPQGWLVVKADVQGAEGLLLDGGEQTFRDRVIAFFSEAQLANMYQQQADFFQLHQRLTDWGFVLRNLYPCMHDERGQALQTDALWVRQSVLKEHAVFR